MFGRKRACVWMASAEIERHHPAAESRRWQKNNTSCSPPATQPAFNASPQNLLIIPLFIITLTFPNPTSSSLHHYLPPYKTHLLLFHFTSFSPCLLTTLSTPTLNLSISNNPNHSIFLALSATTFLPPPSPFSLPFTLQPPTPTPLEVKCAPPPTTVSFINGGLGDGRFYKTERRLFRFLTPLKKLRPLL